MEIKISIITINYNGLVDTCALIDSITFDDTLEVIVVDNGSKEDEATIIEQRYPHVTVVRSPRNLGFAGGNNLGIKSAHGKYLFFINNDTIIRGEGGEVRGESILQPLIDRLESSDKIGMVCPKIRFAWGTNPIQFAGYTPLSSVTMRNRGIGCGEEDHGQYDIPHPTPYAHGAAMMVRREALEKVGMMPECYFLYYEELDWSMMFTRSGYEIWYEPRFTIYHKESQATGQNSPLKTYYLTRNRLLFAHRNIPIPRRFLTYLYLMGLVSLRDIVKHIIQGRKDLAASVTRGLRDFIKRPKE